MTQAKLNKFYNLIKTRKSYLCSWYPKNYLLFFIAMFQYINYYIFLINCLQINEIELTLPNTKLSKLCSNSLSESKAENILFLDVKSTSSFTDEIIIATANSNRHATSVSENLVSYLKKNNINIIGIEGKVDSGWMLVDCGDVVINIMRQDQRDFYALESFWANRNSLHLANDN